MFVWQSYMWHFCRAASMSGTYTAGGICNPEPQRPNLDMTVLYVAVTVLCVPNLAVTVVYL